MSDIREDLAFTNHCRGNPPKVDVEDCMSTREIDICGTLKSRPQIQNKDNKAQIRRRREGDEGMALKI
ncbi:MAG: hypothetical protein WBF32_03135 [Candidatus Aminicenantaceae bacterium]